MALGREEGRSANTGGAVLLILWASVFAGLSVAAFFTERVDIALYGAAACVIVTIPALRRGYDWVSPWSLVMLAFYIGCGARGFAIIDLGLDDMLIQRYFLLGRDVAEYTGPALLFLVGVALLTLGWMVAATQTSTGAPRAIPRHDDTREREPYQFGPYFWLVVLGCAAVGLWGFFRYAAATGGLDLTNLSAKRAGFYVAEEAVYQGSAGQWQAINNLSTIAFWLAVAKFTSAGSRTTPAQKAVLLSLFGNAAILPFYSSVRSELVYIVLTALVIHVCLRGRLQARLVWVAGVAALVLLAVLTLLRQQSEGKTSRFSFVEMFRGISDAMLLNPNFTEVPKAVNVMLAVPEVLPYSYGASITNYALAWVPRSIWPEKPIIDAGVEVGVLVYGTDGSSIPPGAIGEFFWMWGTPTLILGSFLLGYLLCRAYAWARPHVSNVRGALLYGTAIFDLGGNAVSGSVGYAAFSAILAWITMAFVLKFAGGRPEAARPPPASPHMSIRNGTEPHQWRITAR